MANFIDTNINQIVLMDVNYLDQLGKDNFDYYLPPSLNKPHFTTIAKFVSKNTDAIQALFHRVLLACDESGLIGREHFGIDVCKKMCRQYRHLRHS